MTKNSQDVYQPTTYVCDPIAKRRNRCQETRTILHQESHCRSTGPLIGDFPKPSFPDAVAVLGRLWRQQLVRNYSESFDHDTE